MPIFLDLRGETSGVDSSWLLVVSGPGSLSLLPAHFSLSQHPSLSCCGSPAFLPGPPSWSNPLGSCHRTGQAFWAFNQEQLSRAPHAEGSVPGLMLCSCCHDILIIPFQSVREVPWGSRTCTATWHLSLSALHLLPRNGSGHLSLLPFHPGSCLFPSSTYHPKTAVSPHPGSNLSSRARGLGVLYLFAVILRGKCMAAKVIPILAGVT